MTTYYVGPENKSFLLQQKTISYDEALSMVQDGDVIDIE